MLWEVIVHLPDGNVKLEMDKLDYHSILSQLPWNNSMILLCNDGFVVDNQLLLDDICLLRHKQDSQQLLLYLVNIDDVHYACSNHNHVQPYAVLCDQFLLCQMCALNYFDESLLNKNCIKMKEFKCESIVAANAGLALITVPSTGISTSGDVTNVIRKYNNYRLLQLAIEKYTFVNNNNNNELLMRIKQGIDTVLRYELLEYQQEALQVIDYNRIIHHINEFRSKKPDYCNEELLFMQGLLAWFKRDFFKWCNKPLCITCNNSKNMVLLGNESASAANEVGPEYLVSRVEVYKCKECGSIARFPRYNNPKQLLYSRTGRCGEWANCFGLICRALHLDINYVIDLTDHVWVEVYIPSLHRFLHADPCEVTLDTPHMYEKGWKKKLSHVLSFSRYGVYDSISRYTSKYNEVVVRRSEEYDEAYLQRSIQEHDMRLQQRYCSSSSSSSSSNTMNIAALATGSAAFSTSNHGDISVETMVQRKRLLQYELKSLQMNQPVDEASNTYKQEELNGRISGDMEWRQARGECDSANNNKEKKEEVVMYKVRSSTPVVPIPVLIDDLNNIKYTEIAGPDVIVNSETPSNYHYKYLSSRGGTHGDSEPFDVLNDFLLTIIPLLPTGNSTLLYDSLVIDEIVIFAGTCLCNGIQVSYRINSNNESNVTITSPPFTSSQDSPTPNRIKLRANEKIKQVVIQAGALVDGITITTSLGNTTHVGGTGGETYVFNINDNEEVIGFYGSLGGHLHNIGLILRPIPPSSPSATVIDEVVSSSTSLSLLSKLNNKLIEYRLYYSFVPYSGNYYHFVVAILFLVLAQGSDSVVECLQQYLLYSENIYKNLLDEKYYKIKITNKYYMKIRACYGGIALTTVGSLCMDVTADNVRDGHISCANKMKLLFAKHSNIENIKKYIQRFNEFISYAINNLCTR